MGFYGNVSQSNKTALTFDYVYPTRHIMDKNCSSDGVFIGRYVLVDYDEPPIKAYRNPNDGYFYTSSDYSNPATTLIKNPSNGEIYLDLNAEAGGQVFYQWNERGHTSDFAAEYSEAIQRFSAEYGLIGFYIPYKGATGYSSNYNTDVTWYGRGYDSTVWRKTWSNETNNYKYVLVSELNTIVPNFHLIPDAPSDVAAAPYFDRDTTTNVDYFIHSQATWGQSIRDRFKTKTNIPENNGYKDVKDYLTNDIPFDEEVTRVKQEWSSPDNYGAQYVSATKVENINGDIYYNKDGFNKSRRSRTDGEIKNTINYEIDHSGRIYYDYLRTDGTWQNGQTKPDVMEWYIHLPILGDMVCDIWDEIYGYKKYDDNALQTTSSYKLPESERATRYTKKAQSRGESHPLVTYNTDYVIGGLNQMRDLLGYSLKNLEDLDQADAFLRYASTEDAAKQGAIIAAIQNNLEDVSARKSAIQQALSYIYTDNYPDTQFLYYTRKPDTEAQQEVKEFYCAYVYAPRYQEVEYDDVNEQWYYTTADAERVNYSKDSVTLFYKTTENNKDVYKLANYERNYQITLSNDHVLNPIAGPYYVAVPRWRLSMIDGVTEDSIYGILVRLHQLLGLSNVNERNLESINGCINILKDMITNVETQMQPYRLLMTNNHGQITDMKKYNGQNEDFGDTVEYPYFKSVDHQEILDCWGNWRLPVDYKLETFNLVKNGKYFNKYWGNSVYHELSGGQAKNGNYDTIGDAFYKISEELSDIQYKLAERIKSFSANVETATQNDEITFNCTIDNTLSWQQVYYTINNDNTHNSISGINNRNDDNKTAYLTTATNESSGKFIVKMTNTENLTVTLHVKDERDNEETQSIVITYAPSYQYNNSGDFSYDNARERFTDTTTATGLLQKNINNFITNVSDNKYLFIKLPSSNYRLFIDNQYGGFDLFDADNHIYRTTNSSLGTIEVEIYE